MMRRSSPFRRQWGWPIGLALLTLFGLLCALLGEGGLWWWVSWAALAIPLLVLARHLLFAAPPGDLPHARHRAS
jgi:hypothetical protein